MEGPTMEGPTGSEGGAMARGGPSRAREGPSSSSIEDVENSSSRMPRKRGGKDGDAFG